MTTAASSARAPGGAADPAAPTAGRADASARARIGGFRRASRDTEAPILGGVASGLARHLGVEVLWVRAGFVLAAALSGMGIVLYLGLWLVLPSDSRFVTDTPGAESASRGNRRPARRRRLTDVGPAIALAVLAIGAILFVQATLGSWVLFWPLVIGMAGVALLWRQADEVQRERWLDSSGRLDPVRLVFGTGGWASYGRVAAGLVLVVAALGVVGLHDASFSQVRLTLLAGALGVAGLALVVGPWVFRMASDLSAERTERIRSQERADVAAHLHDSVLQTLALIQKNAADPTAVARLARAQERDLRSWLYVGDSTDELTVAGALRRAAAEVEDAHGISVDVVAVGDGPLDESLRPIVAAAREAVTNAAKHAGTARVDVYAEVTSGTVDVFVRDRGAGFDPDLVAEDRHGVRDSIVSRMARHGGTATVRSAPGDGTEVRLHLPRRTADDQPGGQPA